MTLAKLRRWYRGVAAFWLNVCVLFVVANAIALAALSLAARRRGAPLLPVVDRAFERIYANLSEEDRTVLARESAQDFVYEPFTEFRERPSAGRFVNVDPNGFRRTKNQGPWPPDPRYCNVFMFGSSTTFGYGVADEHTIASYLQDLLGAAGLPRQPRVYNFAHGGYYSTQERILFERLVVAGHVPDMAIFVDGPADLIFAYDDEPILTSAIRQCIEAEKHAAVPELRTALAVLPMTRALGLLGVGAQPEQPGAPPAGEPKHPRAYDDPAGAARVIEHYVRNMRLIEGAARAVGTTPAFVWQPSPTYKYDLRYHVHSGSFGVHDYSRFGYPRVAEYVRTHDLGPSFLWCADIQEGVRELLYVDQTHYAPVLSQQLAACILDLLRARGLLACTGPRPAAGG